MSFNQNEFSTPFIPLIMRLEDDEDVSFGIPARVVQYEGNLSRLCIILLVFEGTGYVSYSTKPHIKLKFANYLTC